MVSTASLLGAQHIRDSVENYYKLSFQQLKKGKISKTGKQASKGHNKQDTTTKDTNKHNGMPPSLCGRQMVGPSSQPAVVAQSYERHANRA